MRDSRMTIARRSVVIGAKNEEKPSVKNVTYISPQRTQLGNPTLSSSFAQQSEPKVVQGTNNYSYLS